MSAEWKGEGGLEAKHINRNTLWNNTHQQKRKWKGEGAVRHARNQSLSNFRFHAEKKAEHTWPPPRCVAVFIAAPRPQRRSARRQHQHIVKDTGILILGRFLQTFFFLRVKAANQLWCPNKMDVISIWNRSWDVHHLRCSLRYSRPINITNAAGSSEAASRLQNINQTLRTTVTIATFLILHERKFFLLIYFIYLFLFHISPWNVFFFPARVKSLDHNLAAKIHCSHFLTLQLDLEHSKSS